MSLRLTRVLRGLSARERAVISLRAVIDGEAEPVGLRYAMPDEQVDLFNQFAGVGNGILRVLLPEAIVLQYEAKLAQERLRLVWALASWGYDRWMARTLLGPSLERVEDAPTSELRERMAEIRAHFASDVTPPPPWTVVPAMAEGSGGRVDERTLTGAGLRLFELSTQLERDLPALRSKLLALEAVVEEVVELFGTGEVIPDVMRSLIREAHGRVQPGLLSEGLLRPSPPDVLDEDYAEDLRERLMSTVGD